MRHTDVTRKNVSVVEYLRLPCICLAGSPVGQGYAQVALKGLSQVPSQRGSDFNISFWYQKKMGFELDQYEHYTDKSVIKSGRPRL